MLSVTTEQVQKIASSANPAELFETARLLALIRKEAAQPGAGQIQMLIESLDESFSEKTASLSEAWNASKTHILSGLAGATLAGGTGYAMASKLPNESDEEFGARRRRLALTAGAGGAAVGAAMPTALSMTGMDKRIKAWWDLNKPESMRRSDLAGRLSKIPPGNNREIAAAHKELGLPIPEEVIGGARRGLAGEYAGERALVGAAGGAAISGLRQTFGKNTPAERARALAESNQKMLEGKGTFMENDPHVGAKGVMNQIEGATKIDGKYFHELPAELARAEADLAKNQQTFEQVKSNGASPNSSAYKAAEGDVTRKQNQVNEWHSRNARMSAVRDYITKAVKKPGPGPVTPTPPDIDPDHLKELMKRRGEVAEFSRQAAKINPDRAGYTAGAKHLSKWTGLGAGVGYAEPWLEKGFSKLKAWAGGDKTPELK